MTRLITFTDDNMTIAAEICKESALQNNVDEARIYGMHDIDKDFKQKNSEIFSAKRGPAYWIWKPYLIDRELSQMEDGEYLIYSDAGVEFVNNINHIIDRMNSDVWVFGNKFKHVHWCKADVMNTVFPGVSPHLWENCYQAQASVIVFRNSPRSRKFVKRWLDLCQQPGLIDDSPSNAPNHPEFQEHRHDQAILTALVFEADDISLHWWPAMYNAGNFTYDKGTYEDTYPILFHHHRLRNYDFLSDSNLNRHMQNYFKRKYRIAA
jgi:hypothetical protein